MTTMPNEKQYEYLVIGGTTKAATTSLFSYLKDHPQICGSTIKETRYFLEKDYPLKSALRYDGRKDEYHTFFNECNGQSLKLEATPDYLYSEKAPLWLSDLYKGRVKLVFVLREPISRLKSWYNFAIQRGLLDKSVSFSAYVNQMFELDEVDMPEQYLMALRQGKYFGYLSRWFEYFDSEDISIVFFEEISKDPNGILKQLSTKSGIDSDFYDGFEAEVKNKTVKLKNPGINRIIVKTQFWFERRTHNKLFFKTLIKGVWRKIKPIYLRLNTSKSALKADLPDVTLTALKKYYSEDIKSIQQLEKLPEPWVRMHLDK
ncbi:MAG: hypothetical protein Roseis2KO_22270 [Roseivirga sp.]